MAEPLANVVEAGWAEALARQLGARAEVLAMARDMFYEEPRSEVSKYCSSLALYHINFFGAHASRQSMRLLDGMTHSVLKEHQGRVPDGGRAAKPRQQHLRDERLEPEQEESAR